MSNSPLVEYTLISPNKTTNRNHKIDTITIHCTAGQCTIESLGAIFAPKTRKASSNYGIDRNGKIGMFVEEKDRSWCTSSSENDNRAVTIEVSSTASAPFRVNDAAYESLIKLVADICKRNGIKKLVWSEKKGDRVEHRNGCNMTVHRDYAAKDCPGKYLYDKHPDIVKRVNAILNLVDIEVKEETPSVNPEPSSHMVRVTVNALNIRTGAGIDYYVTGTIRDRGVYTIVEVNGDWGKLKSGAGWINLKYTERVK